MNGLFLLVAVVGLVFGSAGPAAATHQSLQGGGGEAPGEEWGPSAHALCSDSNNQFAGAHFRSTYYLITEDAFTILVREGGTPVALYEGPVSMNIKHGDAVFGPQGARPGECNLLPLVAAPVPLTLATAQGASGGGALNCQSIDTTPGTYNRVLSDVRFDFNVSCTVQGTSLGTRVGVPTTFSMAATQNTSGYLRILTETIAISATIH